MPPTAIRPRHQYGSHNVRVWMCPMHQDFKPRLNYPPRREPPGDQRFRIHPCCPSPPCRSPPLLISAAQRALHPSTPRLLLPAPAPLHPTSSAGCTLCPLPRPFRLVATLLFPEPTALRAPERGGHVRRGFVRISGPQHGALVHRVLAYVVGLIPQSLHMSRDRSD